MHLLLFCFLLVSPRVTIDDERVVEILLDGNSRVTQKQLLDVFKTQVGRPLDCEVLQDDIRAAYARYGVRIAATTESLSAGLRLRLAVDEEQLIQRIEVRGVDPSRGRELLEQASLSGSQAMLESHLRDRLAALVEFLQGEGRYFAKVDVSVERVGDEIVAFLDVVEGEKVAVDDIEFLTDTIAPSRLRGVMTTEESTLVIFKHWLQRDALERDIVEVERFVRADGYRDAHVTLDELRFDDDKEWVDIIIRVDEGVRYQVRDVTFDGNQVISSADLLAEIESLPGEPIRVASVERDVKSITDAYGALGYVGCRVVPEVTFAEEGSEVSLRFEVTEGEKKRVRDVVIRGNTDTLDEVVRRQVTLNPGDVASGTELDRTLKRLRGLSYFQDEQGRVLVDARFRETTDPLLEDLFVDVEESRFGRFFFTAGATTDIGFFAGVQLQKSNFDISDTPSSWNPITIVTEFWRNDAFHGGGQQLDIAILPGNQVTNLRINFVEPFLAGPEEFPWSLEVGLYSRTERLFSEFQQDRYGVSTTVAKQLNDQWSDGVLLRVEGVDIDHVDSDAPSDVKDVEGTNFVPSVGGFVRYRDVDSIFSPTSGIDWGARYEILLADGAGQRFVTDISWFKPLFSDDKGRNHVLALRGALGLAAGSGDSLPFFERFNAGGVLGEFPIRGFEHRRVGPESKGVHLGGELAYSASVEYQYPIYSSYDPVFDEELEWFRGVVFADFGATEDDFGDLIGSPRMAVGAGLRIRVPILGPVPIAIDLGVPVVSESGDDTEILSLRISTRL